MSDGKWITNLTADTPLGEAARVALQIRLQVVCDRLPDAVREGQRDAEHVHQLRVATRRAGAALGMFATYLSSKTVKRAKRRLRHIRRAAGAARDWDVFVLDLVARRKEAPVKEQAGLDYLLGYAASQRAAAQTHLHDIGHTQGRHFADFLAGTLKAVKASHKHEGSLGKLAQPLLKRLLREFETMASGDLQDFEQLHEVRIAGKRLRYAMELFAGCFDASFKETLYPQIEAMQNILGRANDSHVATQRLEAIRERGMATLGTGWKTLQPGVTGLLQFHRRRLPRERRGFQAWCVRWQKEGGHALKVLIENGNQESNEKRQ